MSNRTFKIDSPHMTGDDIGLWQTTIRNLFDEIGIDCPIKVDKDYWIATRSYTASLLTAYGLIASDAMENGVTPELRIKMRQGNFTEAEKARFKNRVEYRRKLRERYESASITKVHRMYTKITEDGWGFKPGVHDGIDVQTPANAVIFAPVKCKVFDVRADGWWNLNAPKNKSLGDGIVQVEILETVGPFLKNHHIGFGHSEHAMVKKGDILDPGDKIARVGLAVVWHTHLMYNNGSTTKGIGNIDPRKILDYAQLHG